VFRDFAECIRVDGVVCFMKRHGIKKRLDYVTLQIMEPPSFLKTVLAHLSNPDPSSNNNYPHVTLTFAQSIDAKIAGKNGQQLILSGKESMVMTHWMRTMHDAILVGIGTALNDDPQLNVRHLPQPTSTPYSLPRPVIIDTHLRLPTTCKLLRNFQNGIGRKPWIICATHNDDDSDEGNSHGLTQKKMTLIERKKALETAGARIIEIPASSSVQDDRFPLSVPAILKSLGDLGIRSLMVEGGARIIASFFAAPEKIVDALIITVAPLLVGSDGVGYQCNEPNNPKKTGQIQRGAYRASRQRYGSSLRVQPTMK